MDRNCANEDECRSRTVVSGHSLGGGLAQYVALNLGLQAYTFNPAGLWSGTSKEIDMSKVGVAKITHFITRGLLFNKIPFVDLVPAMGVQFSQQMFQVPREIPLYVLGGTSLFLEMFLHNMKGLRDAMVEMHGEFPTAFGGGSGGSWFGDDTVEEACASEFHVVRKGTSACGIGLSEEYKLLIDGTDVEVSNSELSVNALGKELHIYPQSPDGHYSIVSDCDIFQGGGKECQSRQLIDHKEKTAKWLKAGKYIDGGWILWSPDSSYALLKQRNHGYEMLFIVRTSDGKVWMIPADDAGYIDDDSLRWLDADSFEVGVFSCKPFEYEYNRCSGAAQRVEYPVAKVMLTPDGPVVNGAITSQPDAKMYVSSGGLCKPADSRETVAKNGKIRKNDEIIPLEGQGVLTGRITDLFGNPVSGATLKIAGSSMKAETDEGGKYRVPYVPGKFSVVVTHENYDPYEFSLELSTASTYPVEDKSLVKVPPGKGIYAVGENDWLPIASCTVINTKEDDGDLSKDGEVRYVVSGTSCSISGEGPLQFLDAIEHEWGLQLYQVYPDGTIISIIRKSGLTGAIDYGMNDGAGGTPVKINKGTFHGNARPFYFGELTPGMYAFVLKPWGPLRVVYPTDICYLFEYKTPEQVLVEERERPKIEKEIDSALNQLEAQLNKLSTNNANDGGEAIQNLIAKIEQLSHEPYAPKLDTNPAIRAAEEMSKLASEALSAKKIDDAVLLATRSLMLDPTNGKAKEIEEEGTYQQQAQLAKEAFAEKNWGEAASSAYRALEIKQEDQDLIHIKDRAFFEDHLADARTFDQAGDVKGAHTKMFQAMNRLESNSSLSFSPVELADLNKYYGALKGQLADIAMQDILKANISPKSRQIDEAVDLLKDAKRLGGDVSKLQEQYAGLVKIMLTSGAYFGKYMEKSIATKKDEWGNPQRFSKIIPGLEGKTFYTEPPLTEWRLDSLQTPKDLGGKLSASRMLGHDYLDNRIFYARSGVGLEVVSRKPNTGEEIGLSSIMAPSLKNFFVTRDGSYLLFNGSLKRYPMKNDSQHPGVEKLQTSNNHRICSITMSKDASFFVIANTDERADFYNTESNLAREKSFASVDLSGADWDCSSVSLSLSDDGRRLFVGPTQNTIKVFDVLDDKQHFQKKWAPIMGKRSRALSNFTLDSQMTKVAYLEKLNNPDESWVRLIDIPTSQELANKRIPPGKRQPTALGLIGEKNNYIIGFNDGSLEMYAPNPPPIFGSAPLGKD